MSKPTPTSTTTQIIPADTLPPELWLDIIPRVPYSPRSLLNIRLTCHRLNTLTTQHETSLVADIKRQQCSSTQTGRFPGLELVGYRDLSTLYGRQQTLDQVHKHWLKVTYASPELKWLKGRWEGIHKTGLLLLYHLQDVEPLSTHEAHSHSKTSEDAIDWVAHCAKVRLLESLPATSLACLLFQLMASIHILRIHGPEPISNKYAAGDVGTRTEVELAFEELLLTHGPDIFMGMLDEGHAKREWTIALLQAEIARILDRQAPFPSGAAKPPTLISSLRRALAEKIGCRVSQTGTMMWQTLSGTAFDEVDDEKMVKLVRGEDVGKGMRRMGF